MHFGGPLSFSTIVFFLPVSVRITTVNCIYVRHLSSSPLCSLFYLLYLSTTTPSHIGCPVLRRAMRFKTSMTSAVPIPMTKDSPNGKSSISRPATGNPTRGTKTSIHIQPTENFLFSFAAASISGELHLSEKPTGPAPPRGGVSRRPRIRRYGDNAYCEHQQVGRDQRDDQAIFHI